MKGQDYQRGVTQNTGPLREMAGVFLLALGVFAIISLYVHTPGVVGSYLREYLVLALGNSAVVFCLVLVYLSLAVFRGCLLPFPWKRAIGFLLILLSGLTLFHFIAVYRGFQLPPSLAEELVYARNGQGAGMLGAMLMVAALTAFGLPGSYVFLGAFLLIGTILFLNVSLQQVFTTIVTWVKEQIIGFFRGIGNRIEEQKVRIRDWREKRAFKRMATLSEHDQKMTPEKTADSDDKPKKRVKKAKSGTKQKKQNDRAEKKAADGENPQEVPTLELTPAAGPYQLPPLYMLKKGTTKLRKGTGDNQKTMLEETFASFGISAKVVNVSEGPVVTRYELQPAPGVKVSKITSLADDLALALAAEDVRIEAPVPGKPVIGIEVPNKESVAVLLRDVLEDPAFSEHPSKVSLALGKDIAGNPVVADLKKWLHLLVAGSTGSGKSVCLNAMIASILYKATPQEVQLLMIDPKRVELAVYNGVPHLISPVVTDAKKAATALRWAVAEMERRYKLFADTGVRNIDMYGDLPESDGENAKEHLPYIVIIVDELADLMMVAAAEVEDAICRLAQMARAAGMYLIIATQRPSVDVITGLIKANVPSRISFAVSSQVDSRTILDMGGAERLIGKGDMLYYPIGASKPTRAQGAWIADKEVEALVSFWKRQGEPDYQEEVLEEKAKDVAAATDEDDELYQDAVELVVDTGQASISMLQRRFRIGYSRAARLIDMMEIRGVVGTYQGSKPREVLISSASLEERGE